MNNQVNDQLEDDSNDHLPESDYLSMSDDEMANMTLDQFTASREPSSTQEDTSEPEEVPPEEDTSEQEDEPESDYPDPRSQSSGEDEGEQPEDETTEIDYEAEYKKVFAPFKANGKEMRIKSAEDAVALMQMGANYNKKMAALKPNLQMMKLLETHGLLDESKISFLIDLEKKNPQAINKLIQDSGLDPLDLNPEEASEYKPNSYQLDDRELAIEAVIEDIKDTPSYNRTLEVIGQQWDTASRTVIGNNPELIRVLNSHVANGIYDRITQEIDHERMLGRLKGLSDIEAYQAMGDMLDKQGELDHLAQGSQSHAPTARSNPPSQYSPQQQQSNLRDKKRAASAPRQTAKASTLPKDFNPLALSDEEFSKMFDERLL